MDTLKPKDKTRLSGLDQHLNDRCMRNAIYYGETTHVILLIAAINACFHIYGVIKLKKYSPCVVTGVLLYIPGFIIGRWQFLLSGDIT